MPIRHRPMEPNDVRACTEMVSGHPVIGPRYGSRVSDLSKAWLRLLGREAMIATVFQDGDSRTAPICFFGVSVFCNDAFVQQIKTAPLRWFGPALMSQILGNESPVLSDRQLQEANSRGGLNLVVWEGCFRPGFETHAELLGFVMKCFLEDHGGFLVKEVIGSQVESVARLRWSLHAGALLWNPTSRHYQKSFKRNPAQIIQKAHVVGLTREMDVRQRKSLNPSWLGSLFGYQAPRCGFSPMEQWMLRIALGGGTDGELAEELGISIPTIKKMWLSAYRRVDENLPELKPSHEYPDTEGPKRGKEKRRHVLNYLRQHPEELRPASKKLLSKAAV